MNVLAVSYAILGVSWMSYGTFHSLSVSPGVESGVPRSLSTTSFYEWHSKCEGANLAL